MKTCSNCNTEKPIEDFHKNTRSKDGRYYHCRPCCSELKKVAYERDKEAVSLRRRVKYQTDPSFHMFHEAKKRAKKQGVPFTLVKEDIVIPDVCPILGIPLRVNVGQRGGGQGNSPSLDKYYPHLGYTKDNINVISNKANSMKSNGTLEEHKLLVSWMEQVEQ